MKNETNTHKTVNKNDIVDTNNIRTNIFEFYSASGRITQNSI